MKVLVIGSGIVGLSTAYALAREGHDVSVVDGAAAPGSATSFANGAQLSYNFVAPLADPEVLGKLPQWLTSADSPLRLMLTLDPALVRWSLHFLQACRRSVALQTTQELLLLGLHSRLLMHEMQEREAFDFDFESKGKLLVYQNEQALAGARAQMGKQAGLGCEQRELSAAQCLTLEPALEDISARVVGGVFTPSEDSGDCHALCMELHRALSTRYGVGFHFNTAVEGFRTEAGRIAAALTSEGDLQADAYVVANGTGAQKLLSDLGMNPLIYPLKGYSLTYTLTPQSRAPQLSVSDVHNKVVYARLGNRLRVAGMVDIGDRSTILVPQRLSLLKSQVQDYLPRLNAAEPPLEWAGLRPARPDSKPLIGKTRLRNLWINGGHGALGFTLAAASAAVLVDRIAGRQSAVPPAMFQL
ncbi:D-amino acid dehydrogenase [Comamonas sp. B21-038]|uniref:D-amino acid dehydrogenase n=1 Tax=Comamonas sp. B21-038 TaxID=2918299 RepID=UPI001EFB23DC|nr:D-amino acid dehydrogenase [Comamonas sp. B21-038]ULR89748.1 D-amino acid dehydrogenase [Comamonas sp. B21-038]